MFPSAIEEVVQGLSYTKDGVGRSKDSVYIFEDKYILKVSESREGLEREKERMDWLSKRLPGSKSIMFIEENSKFYYLRTLVIGDSLIAERFLKNPDLLIESLLPIIQTLRSLDLEECPYTSTDSIGNDFVHGDLCLPNILVDENNHLAGFIDLDNAGKGDRWYDYAWLVWSIYYNLNSFDFAKRVLSLIGEELQPEKIKKYIPLELIKKVGLEQWI